jgi:hypothetical protein
LVDRYDIALLAMSGLRDEYLAMRVKEGEGAATDGSAPVASMRGYLYDKYVYRNGESRREGPPRADAEKLLPDVSVQAQRRLPA